MNHLLFDKELKLLNPRIKGGDIVDPLTCLSVQSGGRKLSTSKLREYVTEVTKLLTHDCRHSISYGFSSFLCRSPSPEFQKLTRIQMIACCMGTFEEKLFLFIVFSDISRVGDVGEYGSESSDNQ